jgi:hypothetical protein
MTNLALAEEQDALAVELIESLIYTMILIREEKGSEWSDTDRLMDIKFAILSKLRDILTTPSET